MTRETSRRSTTLTIWIVVTAIFLALTLTSCGPEIPELPEVKAVPDNTIDPAEWGKLYPVEYKAWLATSEPRPEGKSVYKRGFDGGITYDKLSEWPFMPVLFKGWGFGIDYNEPRGHWYMLRDQSEADPSRVKAGGACLTCKSPSADKLHTERGEEFMSMSYEDAVALLPEGQHELGVSCIDCHDNKTLELRSPRWTVKNALADLGVDALNFQQQRIIVCGQCHVTYSVMKKDGRSVDVNFPWAGGAWGDISIETIIANLEKDPARIEWTQQTTGFKLGFIRHPDMEFFTDDSVHYNAGLGCPDCHMPYKAVDGTKTANHDVMSPLKNDMAACIKCHPETPEELREQVIEIQDRNASMLIDTGYSVAANAKLFELINSKVATQSAEFKADYDLAAGYYREAFYRITYMGAENSVGFHNPSEGGRILRDAMSYSSRCDAILQRIASVGGIEVPDEIDLELGTYLTNRGVKPLGYIKSQTFADPFPTHAALWPKNAAALGEVPSEEPAESSKR